MVSCTKDRCVSSPLIVAWSDEFHMNISSTQTKAGREAGLRKSAFHSSVKDQHSSYVSATSTADRSTHHVHHDERVNQVIDAHEGAMKVYPLHVLILLYNLTLISSSLQIYLP